MRIPVGGSTSSSQQGSGQKGLVDQVADIVGASVQGGVLQYTQGVNVSTWPFRFNPVLHRLSRPVRIDFSTWGKGEQEALSEYFDESYSQTATDAYRTMRLGRIVMAENALGNVGTRSDSHKVRWGFRFLYNPEKLTTSSVAYDQMVFNTGDEAAMIISGVGQNFQVHEIGILINRIPDVQAGIGNLRAADYEPVQGTRGEDLEMLPKWGTMWDLEFLFRMSNGVWQTNDLGQSGNLGLLQPNPAYLILGPGIKHYGFVQAVQYQHLRFNQNMVPMLTMATIVFKRSLHLAPKDADAWLAGLGPYGGNPRLPRPWENTYTHDDSWGQDGLDETDPDTRPGSTQDNPLPGFKVTTPFGTKGSLWTGSHTGDDYGGAGVAGKSVRATRSGVVVQAGRNPAASYGNSVTVETLGGSPNAVRHLYAHLATVSVKNLQPVSAGQVLGTVGSTGNSTGPHLHYEERTGPSFKHPTDCRNPRFNGGK